MCAREAFQTVSNQMVFNFVITRLTATASSSFTRYTSTHFVLGSLLQHKHNNNASLFLFNSFTTSSTSSDSESDANHHKGYTFTVSYLINSCGVSPTLAKELSKRVDLKNRDGPNAVLDLLKNYGFDKTHITKLVLRHPLVLVSKAEKTLLPKLKFFTSIGVSNTDMPKILIANHMMLVMSLEKCLFPRYKILRGIVRDDAKLVKALKNCPRCFTLCDMVNNLVPNIEVLRQCGVPQASISLLVAHFPSAGYITHSRFVEAVETVKQIGMSPLKTNFVMAVQVLLTMRKMVWERRIEFYERWGWNRDMALKAFTKYPNFMKLSETTVTKKMSFLLKDMDWPSEDIAEYPTVLAYNFEKRIIPRFSVIKILKSKSLLLYDVQMTSFMSISEENFLKRFVINFQRDLPLLPNFYKDLVGS